MFGISSPLVRQGWPAELAWVHQASHLLLGLACLTLPVALIVLTRRRLPLLPLQIAFALFLIAVGFVNLLSLLGYHVPLDWTLGYVQLAAAVLAWVTVIILIMTVPRILSQGVPIVESPRVFSDTRAGHFVVALLAAVATVLIRGALDPFLKSDHAFVIPLVAVVFVAWQFGFAPALVTLLLSLAAFDFFFVTPRGNFMIESLSDQMAAGLSFTCGIAAATLGEAQRQARRRLERTLGKLQQVNDLLVASEQTLRESEERYRTLIEITPQFVWTAAADGMRNYFSGSWFKYTRLTAEASQGEGWLHAVHPDMRARIARIWQTAARQGSDYEAELQYRNGADGSYRWFLSRAKRITTDSRKDTWLGVSVDIDDRKRAEELLEQKVIARTRELAAANVALREEVASRTEAEKKEQSAHVELRRSNLELEQFAYAASHDLQEPLRKIQAFGGRLKGQYAEQLGQNGQDYLNRMLVSATRMQILIQDLLAFSRVSKKEHAYTRVPLSVVAADVVRDLEVPLEQAHARVTIGALPVIEADPTQMRQLFQNLIGNAVKFRKPEVAPEISIKAKEPTSVSEDATTLQQSCTIEFADNGIGFDDRHAERIFLMFQRLHGRDEYEGTGIGLAICRKIAERHGGTLTAKGRPGVGATFVLTLPITHKTPTSNHHG